MSKKLSTHYYTIAFILISSILFVLLDISPVYYNNDDFFLKQIASGELTGIPETHLLHIGYLTGCFLSLLYRCIPTLPWYGILLFSYYCISISVSFHSISRLLKKHWHKLIFCVLFCLVSVSFLWIHMMRIQYTTITAIVCGASLVQFYLSEEDIKPSKFIMKNWCSLLFFFLSMELRNKACLMFLPTFALFGLTKLIKNKKMFPSIFTYGCTLLCILVLTAVTESIAYSADTWNSFKEYNTAREQVVDYNGYPDYETYTTQYETHGITYDSFLAASTRYQILLDDGIDTEFMKDMADISYHPEWNFQTMLQNFTERHISSYTDRPLNIIVYICYFFTLMLILLSRKWRALADLLALVSGRMIIWTYLLLINRPEPRVTQGIYIAEFLLIIAICIKNRLREATAPLQKYLLHATLLCFIGCTIFACVKWGLPQTRNTAQYCKAQITYGQNYQELRTYFDNNAGNLYLLDTNSFSYFLEGIFQSTPPSQSNSTLMGGWIANSPWTNRIAAEFGITSYEQAAVTQDNVFFVFLNTEATTYDYLNTYLNSKYPGTSLELHDTLITSDGLEFYILKAKQTITR